MKVSRAVLSHIGSLPVPIPKQVKLISTIQPANTLIQINGPLGQHTITVPNYVTLTESSSRDSISFGVVNPSLSSQRARWGLSRTLVSNAVTGVSAGYTKELNLVGVGYRASMTTPTQLHLKLGFAHPVLVDLPSDVVATTPSSTSILLSGIDKQRVGEVAASIRRYRVPEPYNVSLA